MINLINYKKLGVSKRTAYRWLENGNIPTIQNYDKNSWLTIKEASTILGVSRSTIHRWATIEEVFEVLKLGPKTIRISKESVDEMFKRATDI